MSKKKHYLKDTKETIARNSFSCESESAYFEHRIEKRENKITFRAYIEKSFNTNSQKDIDELNKILEEQKTPLPKVMKSLERDYLKEKIGNIYKYTDMYQVKQP